MKETFVLAIDQGTTGTTVMILDRRLQVRAKVNQADVNDMQVGLPVRIGLDAYPDLSFTGRITQISPLAVRSSMSQKVRTFTALIAVDGSHPNLMPDLTASLDVEFSREARALVVPRDALRYDGDKAFVRLQRGSSFTDQPVTVASINAHEAVISSGIDEGSVVARNVNGRGER